MKVITSRLESLDWTNTVGRHLPSFNLGNSSDRTRTSVIDGLWMKLHESMARFSDIWEIIEDVLGDGVAKILYCQRWQGRGEVVEVTAKLRQRHVEAVKLERQLHAIRVVVEALVWKIR
ncbi:Syntaxin-121 [Striga hermonthica]|uniref:Syntaxin-121 n=1 Tax=Striga hermonthica TaxID=68872 RepID=A0A9N7R5X6_STRHE|nr:Syntaxin-121 [Striga hermonthica]